MSNFFDFSLADIIIATFAAASFFFYLDKDRRLEKRLNQKDFNEIDIFYRADGFEEILHRYISYGTEECKKALNKQMGLLQGGGPNSWITFRNDTINKKIADITHDFADINTRFAEVSERLSKTNNKVIQRFIDLHKTNIDFVYCSVPSGYFDMLQKIINDPHFGNGIIKLYKNNIIITD